MQSQITDPFQYIKQLTAKGWEVCAGFATTMYYMQAIGHKVNLIGVGDDLIHAFVEMKEKVEGWEHEQEAIDGKDQQDTIQSLIADTRQA
jgi:hypothetical protein